MENIKRDITVIGSGGHSKTVCSAIESMMYFNIKVLDNDTLLTSSEDTVVIAIGDDDTRNRIVDNISNSSIVVKDIESNVDEQTSIGEGTVILKGATIQRDATIGKHCIINTNASVDHDCNIGNFTHIAPGVNLCGNVTVGNNTLIGVGSSVIPGITIGNNVVIGAGSVVVKDIPDNVMAFGNPCKYE
tara:strand:- start:22 stop:585 length:564 start_codon:yes stop_codon:yes gene_type:complete